MGIMLADQYRGFPNWLEKNHGQIYFIYILIVWYAGCLTMHLSGSTGYLGTPWSR